MWGLLAAFGPVGWAAATIGTAVTVYAATSSTDEDETSTYSDKSEKEAEAREYAKVAKKKKIKQEIEAYKKQQMKRLKEKYNINVEFNSATIKVDPSNNLFDSISILENETEEMIKLIEKLEVDKHATTN